MLSFTLGSVSLKTRHKTGVFLLVYVSHKGTTLVIGEQFAKLQNFKTI